MSSAIDPEHYAPFVESDAEADAGRLRADMHERGYLFFRRLVPAQDVLAVRRAITAYLQDAG